MSKKKYTKNKKDKFHTHIILKKNGYVEYILIFFIVIFGIMLTGVLNNFSDTNRKPNETYKIVTPTKGVGKNTLQLQSLQFTIITPTPGSSSSSPGNGTPCTSTPPKDLPALLSQLKSKYGINLYGSTISGGGALAIRRATDVFETMCQLFQSSTYVKNLNSLGNTVNIKAQPGPDGNCFAWTTSGRDVWMEEPCDQDMIYKYIVIHEITHVMQKGGALGRNAHWAEWQQIWNVERNHRIPTGPCVIEESGDGGECEADAVAEFVYYKQYRNTWGGSPGPGRWSFNPPTYPTEWSKWYGFAQSKIFGFSPGHDFYNP